jgi:acetyl-CoA C-acetyltransferase
VLREDVGAVGLCSANGGFLTKHSVGLYSTTPPADGFRAAHPQDEVDAAPSRELVADHVGDVTVEGYVVMHDREGTAQNALASVLTPDGRRAWATTNDATAMKAMMDDEHVGRPATVDADGTLSI